MTLQWKSIDTKPGQLGTFRAKVFRGWLVRYVEEFYIDEHKVYCTQNMEFIPDPEHLWKSKNY